MRDVTRFLGQAVRDATQRPPFQRYGLALTLPLLALLATASLTQLSRAPFFSLFTLGVLLASIFGGTKPGLVAAGMSVFINIFSMPPFWSPRIASSEDVVRVLLFGCVACVVAAFVGATGELQRRLEIERLRLAITLQSIGDAVIATDNSGRITFMNSVAEQATGWPLKDATGLALEDVFKIINESTRAIVENPVRKVLERGTVVGLANHTLLVRRDATEIPIDDSAAPIRDPKGNIVGVVLVFRDITEAKLSQKALMQAEKLSTVGRLASTIAHEINNPLESVSNLLFLIGQDAALSEATKGRVQMAESELARAAEITNQTLAFHRVDTTRSQVSLRSLVDSALRLYESRAAGRSIDLKNEIEPSLLVHASPGQLRQLVSNLVSNALDSMEKGGTLLIHAELANAERGEEVHIIFTDTGHGIEPSHLKRIFEPFFTTKRDVGTGLGLWVSKRIVADHDGRLLVTSNTNGEAGTTFTVVLPQEERSDSISNAMKSKV
jgi:PAS domain S-box-containing protein